MESSFNFIRIHLLVLIFITSLHANCQSSLSWTDVQDDFLNGILAKWKTSSIAYSDEFDLSKVQQIESRLTTAFDDVEIKDEIVKSSKWAMLKFLFDNGLLDAKSNYFIFETFQGDRILYRFLNEKNLETAYQIVMHRGYWKVRQEVKVNGEEIIDNYSKMGAYSICAKFGLYSKITIVNRFKDGDVEIKVGDESCY